MMMSAGLRKFALTTHVLSSVGWLGAVVGFLALSIAGVVSQDALIVRASYVAMHLTTWFVIVPFCLAALITGIAQSLGTPWGLFRHYWVVTKLTLTILATFVLLLHTQPIDQLAQVATHAPLGFADLRQLRLQLVGDASAALFVLLMTTALSIYKPWGMTPYGIRRQFEESNGRRIGRRARASGQYVLIGIGAFLVLILLLHLFGGGLHSH
jgi:hypothetical protein